MTTSTAQAKKNLDSLKDTVHVRAVEVADLGFIFSTWVNGFHFGNPFSDNEVAQKQSMKRHRRILEYIIGFPAAKIALVALNEDPDVIVGYSVFEPKKSGGFKLHWVYVRDTWRKLGIGKMLVPDGTNEVTHLTNIGRDLLPEGWSHTPLI